MKKIIHAAATNYVFMLIAAFAFIAVVLPPVVWALNAVLQGVGHMFDGVR